MIVLIAKSLGLLGLQIRHLGSYSFAQCVFEVFHVLLVCAVDFIGSDELIIWSPDVDWVD